MFRILSKNISLLFIIGCLLCGQLVFAKDSENSNVKWMNYSTALSKAKKEPKLIFVDLYADWCVPCKIMDKNVYSDPMVASLLNTKFYPVKLNTESSEVIPCDGQKLPVSRCFSEVWELQAIPAFVLVAPKGLSILTVTDSMETKDMLYLLKQFLAKEKDWIEK